MAVSLINSAFFSDGFESGDTSRPQGAGHLSGHCGGLSGGVPGTYLRGDRGQVQQRGMEVQGNLTPGYSGDVQPAFNGPTG